MGTSSSSRKVTLSSSRKVTLLPLPIPLKQLLPFLYLKSISALNPLKILIFLP